MAKKPAIICDIDGTLMDIRHRISHNKPFLSKTDDLGWYETDSPNYPVVACVKAMYQSGAKIIFVSGRTEIGRVHTLEQIYKALSLDRLQITLHMRQDGDYRKDSVIKQEIYTKLIEPHYEVLFCLDDRNQVVEFWRSIGLACFQVQEGNF